MMQKMPFNDYKWVTPHEAQQIDWKNFNFATSTIGYILEVDLCIDSELHDYLHEFPPMPINMNITEEMLSPYQIEHLASSTGKKHFKMNEKRLCAHLGPRYHYVVHASTLSVYLKLGVKITKFHKALSFQQKEVFKPYIEECTRLRIANAENPFKKSFFKSLICSLYGRMAMKAYSGLQIFFCNKNKIIFDKYSKHPNLHSFKRIDKDLCLFYLTPRSAPKNQFPQYAFSILEVSKACMYESFYFTFKIILPDIKCHMTDTDRYVFFHTRLIIYVSLKKCYYSFLCSFSTPSLPETLKKLQTMGKLDTSNYPENHSLYSDDVKCKPGIFKDETAGQMDIKKAVCLKSKSYALLLEPNEFAPPGLKAKEDKKCKGVPRISREKYLTFQDYQDCLFESKEKSVNFSHIISENYHVKTKQGVKKSLTCVNIKAFYMCPVHSTPFYSKYIQEWKDSGMKKCLFCK